MKIDLSVEESATLVAALEGWLDAFSDVLPEESAKVRSVIEKIMKEGIGTRSYLSQTQIDLIALKVSEMILGGEFDSGDSEMSMSSPFEIVNRIYDLVRHEAPGMPESLAREFAQERARIVIDAYWEHKRGPKQ